MNYISEIREFYDLAEQFTLSSSCICLWHALMYQANKARWKEEFSVAISTLELRSGLTRSSIYRARNQLTQYGFISVKERDGRQSAIYKINSLCSSVGHNTEHKADTKRNTTDTQSGHKAEPLNNTNVLLDINVDEDETKEKNIDVFFESVWKLYPEKKGKTSVSKKNKKALFKLGYAKISEAIQRYVENKPDWKHYQHGSTFFNGGYIDYLEPTQQEEQTKTGGGTY